ncbi:MAG: hypothetical protein HC870_00050 [Rhizobiales bacterium]|nr:hypothetical protein [Hyphomicrobiales bacterium]
MTNLPWHTKILLALLAFLPVYFGIAALGTNFGLWSWQTGLLSLTMGGGVILLGIVAVVALVSLILAIRATPRRNGLLAAAILGLLVPGATFVMFLAAGAKAGENPIHDIATDTANPPAFSAATASWRERRTGHRVGDECRHSAKPGENSELAVYRDRRPEQDGRSGEQFQVLPTEDGREPAR